MVKVEHSQRAQTRMERAGDDDGVSGPHPATQRFPYPGSFGDNAAALWDQLNSVCTLIVEIVNSGCFSEKAAGWDEFVTSFAKVLGKQRLSDHERKCLSVG